ncbi:MAG: peptide ABC transporter substrate-binding protein [Ectothiorhodospiraceae bacterium]|nr:peptide ABC transporter substrate-binding protein [Ectothiorhodospiraceae bacterium]
MGPRALLIGLPLVVIAVLALSAFWVPGYRSADADNPERAASLVLPSSADPKILNPILHADTASGRVVDLVFEGLLDLDEDLALRGRLARSWSVRETAYLVVPPAATLADGTHVDAETLRARIEAHAAADPALRESLESVVVEPPQARLTQVDLPGDKPARAMITWQLPARLRLELAAVDQDLELRLRPLLGADYGRDWPGTAQATVEPAELREAALARPGAAPPPLLEHNPTITFELRTDARFHDGHPVDAHDVEFTYRAIMDPRNLSPRTSDFEPIDRVEVLDAHRVRVVYRRLFSPAINAWTMGILPAHLLDDEALRQEMERRALSPAARERFGLRDSQFNRAPIGSGPFRFGRWLPDELVELQANREHWGGGPRFARFTVRTIPEPLTQEMEFLSGALDLYTPLAHQARRYRDDPDLRTHAVRSRGYTYIGYNTRRAPFDDPRVRRALGMAIDVEAIIEHVLYGEGDRTTGPYPLGTEWYDPSVTPLAHDPGQALALLESVGFRRNAEGWLERDGKPLAFTLITNNGNALRKAVLGIAQDAWRRIGIQVATQLVEWSVFLEEFVNPGQFDALVLGWSMGVDPDLYQLFHSSQTGPRQLNFVGLRDDRLDTLIERLRREYDRDAQRGLAHDLHRRIAELAPYTFLYAPRATWVHDPRIAMRGPAGDVQPLRPSRSGDMFFHLERWDRLSLAP